MFGKKKTNPEQQQQDSSKNLLVIGGTGRVGQEVIKQALAQGYNVRATTRDISRSLTFEQGSVEWQQCDVTNKECMQKAVEDRGVVVSSICSQDRSPNKLFADSFRVLADVMKEKKVSRLVALTVDWDSPSNSWFSQNFLRRFYKNMRIDMGRMENMLEMRPKDSLKWTCIKTLKIVPGAYTGVYKVGLTESQLLYKPEISTGDLADFILKEIKQNDWVHKFVTIGT